jgi:hypothetical protein
MDDDSDYLFSMLLARIADAQATSSCFSLDTRLREIKVGAAQLRRAMFREHHAEMRRAAVELTWFEPREGY